MLKCARQPRTAFTLVTARGFAPPTPRAVFASGRDACYTFSSYPCVCGRLAQSPDMSTHMTHSRSAAPSILIIRMSAIGDVLMASPVAQVLRETYPDAHIAWAVEPLSAPLVRANPCVDEVIVLDILDARRHWRKKQFGAAWRALQPLARELRARQFDIAIDCQGLLKSGLISWMTAAPQRLGCTRSREGSHFFATQRTPWPTRPTHLADKYLTMLTPLGIAVTPRRPLLAIPAADRQAARAFLTAQGVSGPYVACCVSSSRQQKDWIWERWGALAQQLQHARGWRTVLVAGPECRDRAAALAETSGAISAAGYLPLLQSAALVQDAAVVVGLDTGLTYAGLATDTPTVALYGSTDATWLTEEPHTVICMHPYACGPCDRRPTCTDYACMRAIAVDEVAAAVARVHDARHAVPGGC